MGSPKRRDGILTPPRVLAGAVSLLVAAAATLGLLIAGSPSRERERQFDNDRVADLSAIASAADSVYVNEGRLPDSLDELERLASEGKVYRADTVDPQTGVPYGYRTITTETYELCAVFSLPSADKDAAASYARPYAPPPFAEATGGRPLPHGGYRSFSHDAGRQCFTLDASAVAPKSQCSLTQPCAAGQTCAILPGRSGAVCVPEGRECLAAGCEGQCVIAESYPVQVRCVSETQ